MLSVFQRRVSEVALKADDGQLLTIRIGVHTGSAVGAIVGRSKKFQYDLWGPAVWGSRALEERAPPGGTLVSSPVVDLVHREFITQWAFDVDEVRPHHTSLVLSELLTLHFFRTLLDCQCVVLEAVVL
jgi:class 3 adenylate cyclase